MVTTTPMIMVETTEPSVPTVTLTIIPPSRPPTPRLDAQALEGGANSLPSLSSLSPYTFSSRPSSVSEGSDDGIFSCTTSVTDLSITNEEYGARTTVYHIYRAGKCGGNLTVHTIKDTRLVEQLREEIGPVVLHRCSSPTDHKLAQKLRALASPPPKRIKADDNKTDPRKATYYMHSPVLWFKDPPRTLRFGGDKSAPVVCLIKGGFFWRTWRLDFVVPEDKDEKEKKRNKSKHPKPEMDQRVDSGFAGGSDEKEDAMKEIEKRWKGLNEPGVIDPRGVLASKYPLRPHMPGEKGKAYVTEQMRRRKSMPMTIEQLDDKMQRSNSFPEKARGFFRTRSLSSASTIPPPPAPTPEPEFSDDIFPVGPRPQDLPDHLKPEFLETGSLLMKWSGWLTREYMFVYRGVEFRWKGTGTVKDEKRFLGPWSKFNHLKLVAILPDDDAEARGANQEKGLKVNENKLNRRGSFSSFVSLLGRRDSGVSAVESEGETKRVEDKDKGVLRHVVIAKYTCLAALRKAGRLAVYEHGLEKVTDAHHKFLDGNDFNNEKERLKHVVVATALCMLQGEKEKRDTILQILEAAASSGGG